MANRKISNLTALTTTATGDLLPIVDISEAGAVDKNKKITIENLFKGIPGSVGIGTSSPSQALDVATPSATNVSIRVRNTVGVGDFYALSSGDIFVTAQNSGKSLLLGTLGTEQMRIDPSGRLLVGTSSPRTITSFAAGGAKLQVEGITYQSSSLSLINNQANTDSSYLVFGKSRGTSTGSATVVNSNDLLGALWFVGADGTSLIRGAMIEAFVDGTPGVNDMPGRLVFSTTADGAASPTERIRITNEGYLLFNHTSTTLPGVGNTNQGLTFERAASNGATVFISRDATCLYLNRNSNGAIQDLRRSGTSVGTITVTATATAYNTSSDYRLKENVVPLTRAIDRLNDLQVRRFNFIVDPDHTVDGFIAHEAQAVVPECVTGTKDEVDDDGNPKYQGIDQAKLVPLLTAALQEAIAKIETLEARLTAAGIA
jgi:hypothetical protein